MIGRPRCPPLRWRVAVAAMVAATASACIPWVVGETAETVAPGAVRAGVGLGVLAPPGTPTRLLPVPQLQATMGVRTGLDASLSYVPPLTAHARMRAQLKKGSRVAAAGTLGLGIHGVPDVVGADQILRVPFATGGLQLSTRGAAPRWYGAVRAVVPFHRAEITTATVWLAGQAGVELGRGRLRWGGELGAVVPTVHPDRTQLLLGLSARWTALP